MTGPRSLPHQPVTRRRHRSRIVAGSIAVAILIAAPFVPRVLRACGPYFSLEILSSREDALLAAPPSTTMTIVDGLVPTPGDKLPVAEGDNDDSRTQVELQGLSPEHAERLTAMRARSDGDAAYAAGEGLRPVVRDYAAGAVSYRNQQLDKARDYFSRVLTLDTREAAQEPRVVWARYMLGTIARLQGDVEGASAHWTATRGLVRSGLPDPLGLAVASLGEEARLWLKPGTLAKAVTLYATQAEYGSLRARNSLQLVAKQLVGDPAMLDEGIRDATTRRLILRYLYVHGAWVPDEAMDSETAADAEGSVDGGGADGGGAEPDADASADASSEAGGEGNVSLSAMLQRVFDAIERQEISHTEDADLLAAQAYAGGRFELAARFAAYESTPLSAWIKGKLALRRGDRQAALRAFSDAVKGLSEDGVDPARARAETGALHLSAGDFTQATELFYRSAVENWGFGRRGTDYWADLAYLAERVLTLNELLPLVDRIAPLPARADVLAATESGAGLAAVQLRVLAGRRLMRAGRYEEAMRYFEGDEHLQGIATEYVNALSTARSRWRSQGTRAEAWFAAATIARFDGMELFGFELAPDYAMYDGDFEGINESEGFGAEEEEATEEDAAAEGGDAPRTPPAPARATPPPARIDALAPTEAERQRVEASKPAVNSRFHYRLTAVDHALEGANFVPASSQAFAAILCRATGWIIDREPERAAKVYARYLNEGAFVPWARNFGRNCPHPDFDGAERRRWKERFATVTWIYTRHPFRTIGMATLIAIAGLLWLTRHASFIRRSGSRSPSPV